jgi:hypothetical protein
LWRSGVAMMAAVGQVCGNSIQTSRSAQRSYMLEGRPMNYLRLKHGARHATIALTFVGLGLIGVSPSAKARVTQINITDTEAPTFGGASFGSVGQYERIEGTITGEVDPKDPLNAVIVDIERAPKNANGMVSYKATFQLLRPIDLNAGNHRVIFELPNRGRTNVLGLFNDSATPNTTTSAGDPGNGFLMNQGYTIVEGAWDTSAQGAGLFTVQFPIATKKDGSTITGPATEEFVVDVGSTPASEPLTYPAATADKSNAFLTVRENYGDAPQTVHQAAGITPTIR